MTTSRKTHNKLYTETYVGELWWLEKHFDIYNIEIQSDNKNFVKYVSQAVNMAMKEYVKMEDERLRMEYREKLNAKKNQQKDHKKSFLSRLRFG